MNTVTVWLVNTANETVDLVTMDASELGKCQRVRILSDGEWLNGYIHPDY